MRPFLFGDQQLLTYDNLLRIARRYDTVMAHAMMRALGHGAETPGGHRRGRGRKPASTAAQLVEERRYRGMAWCFANHGSPMDRR